MQHKLRSYIIILASIFAGATYAASGSLWGDIDDPNANKPPAATIKPEEVNVLPTAPVVEKKTTCEILKQQTELGKDIIASAKVQDALRNNSSTVANEYKAFLANPDSVNDLYKQFRDQYLKKFCAK